MKYAGVVGLLSILASPVRADVSVRAADGRVGVDARAAPLSRVLDLLSRQTGMKVVYDGPVPIQLVSVSLSQPSLRDVVYELLDGQGLDYALGGDAKAVKILVVITRTALAGARAAAETPDDEGPPVAEEGEEGIPAALRPLLPPPADPKAEAIPPVIQSLMDERDRSTGSAPAPSAAPAIPPALLALTSGH